MRIRIITCYAKKYVMNISIIISVTGTLISIVSVCYVILSHRGNRGRLKIYFDIVENGLRIYAFNIGHRPLGIQDVGYYSWTSGRYMVRGNKQTFILLSEGEVKIFEEKFERDRSYLADIKNIGVRDISGKVWYCDKYQVARLNEHIYMEPNDQGYFTKRMDSDNSGRKTIRNRRRSLKTYLKFIKENKYKNKLQSRLGLHAADFFISNKISR